jgi:hypothetical protein
MATQLLTDDEGRNAIKVAQQFLLKKRLSRFFERNLVMSYEEWKAGGGFNLSTTLDDLNDFHDQEIRQLYRLLSVAGGLPSTIADVDVYVDSVNGSDETGDGSSGNPYASMWFLDNLPHQINHIVDILITADYTHTDHIHLDFVFGPNGCFNIIGVGAPTVLQHNLAINSTGLLDDGLGRYFGMTTPFAADYANEFLMAIDGPDIGITQAIHERSSANYVVTVPGAFNAIANGHHVDVVQPTIKLKAPAITCDCHVANAFFSVTNTEAKVSFFNLKIEVGTTLGTCIDCFLIENSCPQCMSFCQILPVGGALAGTMRIASGSELNTQNGNDVSAAKAASGVLNISELSAGVKIAGLSVQDMPLGAVYFDIICEGILRYLSNRGRVYLKKTPYVEWVTCERFIAQNAHGGLKDCLCQGRQNTAIGGGIEIENSKLSIDGFSALDSDNIIVILTNSDLILNDVGLDTGYTTNVFYGIYFLGIGRVELDDDGVRLTGSADGIYFATVAAPFAEPIPGAAYGFVSDNIGPTPPNTPDDAFFSSFVKRMST